MKLPPLLFVTNPDHDEPDEDMFLGAFLQQIYHVEYVTPREAPRAALHFNRCLLRNAWPSSSFARELRTLRDVILERRVRAYSPPHRGGYVEDKSYLSMLWGLGYPVIPTVESVSDLGRLGLTDRYVIKPKDGCSSIGIEFLSRSDLEKRHIDGYLIQPEIAFLNEISFFFVDGEFTYAMVSAGRFDRWDLRLHKPSPAELSWARRFMSWNRLPYGLERIDACRLPDGTMLLMEIEDKFPFLSLADLPANALQRVLGALAPSLLRHLGPQRFRRRTYSPEIGLPEEPQQLSSAAQTTTLTDDVFPRQMQYLHRPCR